jgi:hypothetical protein
MFNAELKKQKIDVPKVKFGLPMFKIGLLKMKIELRKFTIRVAIGKIGILMFGVGLRMFTFDDGMKVGDARSKNDEAIFIRADSRFRGKNVRAVDCFLYVFNVSIKCMLLHVMPNLIGHLMIGCLGYDKSF